MHIRRLINHILSAPWRSHRHFSAAALRNIEAAIAASERKHSGQIRFAVESALHPYEVWQGKTPRQRALELFARLGIWDTEHNNGVLIYLLLADRDVEIIADRGINTSVGSEGWETICQHMQTAFRQGHFEAGVISGIELIGDHLQKFFPANTTVQNELPNAPVVL